MKTQELTSKGDYKIIPEKYENVFDTKLMVDLSKKRLTPKERLNLEVEFQKSKLDHFYRTEVQDAKVLHIDKVRFRNGDEIYVAILDNGHELEICNYSWDYKEAICRHK